MRPLPVSQCCAVLLLAGSLAVAGAPSEPSRSRSRLSSDLAARIDAGDGATLIDVIVQADDGALLQVRASVKRRGAATERELRVVNGLAATLPLSEIASLADEGGVRRISPDRPVGAAMDVAAIAAGAPWSRGLSPGSSGPTGRGVGVALIDSGIYPHEEVAGAVSATIDFVDPERRGSALASDPYGHGTHVAGIIAGRPVASPGEAGAFFGGVAPGAHLVSLRVLDHRGLGRSSDVIAALGWCIEQGAAHGLRVVNLSLGQPVREPSAVDPLDQAVEKAWRAGLVVVASAGNAGLLGAGYGMVSSPGNDPLVITVGALNDRGTSDRRDDVSASFSSRGPTRFDLRLKPDLVAPGTRIVSLRAPHSTLDRLMSEARVSVNSFGGGPAFEPRYFEMSGSSMAAAMVSGIAALMLEDDPTLSPDDIKARLMRQAEHLGGQDIYTRGAGAVDAAAAIGSEGRASASVSPAVSLDPGAADDVVIADTGPAWGDVSLWGLEELYGDPALWGEEATLTSGFFDDPCLTGQGLSWQGLNGEGLSWQGLNGEGLSWQGLAGEGLSWQGLNGEGLSWQGLSGDGAPRHPSSGEGLCPY